MIWLVEYFEDSKRLESGKMSLWNRSCGCVRDTVCSSTRYQNDVLRLEAGCGEGAASYVE